MKSVAVSEFKAQCLALLEDVARTGEPLLVTKRGKPLARVTGAAEATVKYPQDTLAGTVTELADIIQPAAPRERWTALRGRARSKR
jgi:prevent-host-death family protein